MLGVLDKSGIMKLFSFTSFFSLIFSILFFSILFFLSPLDYSCIVVVSFFSFFWLFFLFFFLSSSYWELDNTLLANIFNLCSLDRVTSCFDDGKTPNIGIATRLTLSGQLIQWQAVACCEYPRSASFHRSKQLVTVYEAKERR